jgi:DNA (cytosine-5)-methyltransferase 1
MTRRRGFIPLTGDRVDDARRKLPSITLEVPRSKSKKAPVRINHSSQATHQATSPRPQINFHSSPLSTPPPTGSLHLQNSSSTKKMHRSPNQKLTYGDAHCGAGGSTRGALQAGLRVKWGFDFNPTACTTWSANFPHDRCFKVHTSSFVSLAKSSPPQTFKFDILHLSTPCQFFSPAHSVPGPDDEMNVASLFGVRSVIEVARSRVVTLEQTYGISAFARFRVYFNALVQTFTALGFSVRWVLVGLCRWVSPLSSLERKDRVDVEC